MTLAQSLETFGLYLRGATRLDDAELEAFGLPVQRPWLALVGNHGSSYWPVFNRSAEIGDGAPNPLDRWSRRVAETVAGEYGLVPLYPFEGPPYYPFQQWATRAEGLRPSPLGVLMHPRYGLWHSYRFALLGTEFACDPAPTAASPCLSCRQRPCLRQCPVAAFDGREYDVSRCAAYLQATPDAACHDGGCLARLACPVAPELRYVPEQGRFHLRAFLKARSRS